MIQFGQPLWFWAFALFPILLVLFLRNESQRKRLLQKLVAARLAGNLVGTVSPARRRIRFSLLLLGFACVIVSLTQPRMGYTWQERKTRGRDVIIAVDVSRSMLANDLAPDRLTRARLAAEDLISHLGGDRVGLVAFAGSAFLQAPLTADHSAVLTALYELDPEIIPRGGTNIAAAIRTAVEAFGKGESDNRALVIFTDGEELDADGIKVAKDQSEIAKIFTVGVGSSEGTVIALPGRAGETEYLKDPQGQIVKSRLDEERLRAIAQATGGFYIHLQNAPAQMRQLVSQGISSMSENEINGEVARQPIERYQWPLTAGVVLLITSMLIGERKKEATRRQSPLTSAAVWITLLLFAGTLHAQSPKELYEEGRYKEAQDAYAEMLRRNPNSDLLAFNHGAAAYKNKDFKTALEAFGKAVASEDSRLRAKAEYNLGNTLFQQATSARKEPDIKTLESALSHFDQARQLDAKDADAQHNYDATKQLIEQLKQQQEQQKKDEQKKDQKQDQKDQKDKKDQEQSQGGKDDKEQQKSQGDKKDQQKQDQQKQEQQSGEQQQKQDQGQGGQNQQQSEGGKPDEKEQKGEKGDQEKKNSEGSQKEEREEKEKSDDAESEQKGEKGEEGKPEKPNRKLEGDLKTDPVPGEESKEAQEQQEAAEQEIAAAEGRMTEAQAKALLDSLKSDDQRVRLWEPQGRQRQRPLRDW